MAEINIKYTVRGYEVRMAASDAEDLAYMLGTFRAFLPEEWMKQFNDELACWIVDRIAVECLSRWVDHLAKEIEGFKCEEEPWVCDDCEVDFYD